jgi:hypothetical protein
MHSRKHDDTMATSKIGIAVRRRLKLLLWALCLLSVDACAGSVNSVVCYVGEPKPLSERTRASKANANQTNSMMKTASNGGAAL